MYQSVNESNEYEPDATLPQLPSYREYDEASSASVRCVNNRSDAPPTYQTARRNVDHGNCIWKGLRQAVQGRRKKEQKDGWRPVTLRAPILGGFVFFSLSIIVLLEILAYISSGKENMNGGGLAFAADVNRISTLATFGFLYLPTILSVIYSMLWSWVDLDIKRLEPWFQLSREGGASAKDSLLLQYPFDFLPFVPITAGRRKHWGVFMAGTIVLLVFWIITPLQSAIFNVATATRTIQSNMVNTASLISLESQTNALNANFLNTAYGISWLSQMLPAFTTYEYAVLPFEPVAQSSTASAAETWSTQVDAYGTNLSCYPADVTLSGLAYTFSNGKGCLVPHIALPDAHYISQISQADSGTQSSSYMVLYVGYYDNAELDYALQNPNCSAQFSNNFLALYAPVASRTAIGVYSNLTALFCEPSYYIAEMNLTVNASDKAVANNYPGVPRIDGSSMLKEVFNTTNFEYLLATGVTATGQRANYPDSVVLEQYPRLRNYSLTWPVSNMVGFAVALNPFSVDSFADPAVLQGAFERAHQLLFSVAFNTFISNSTVSDQRIRGGTRRETLGAIILVRTISIIVEAAFAMIIVLTVCLWYYTYQRISSLTTDPASIADIMSILRRSNLSPDLFRDDGTVTMTALEHTLSKDTFILKESSSDNNRGPGFECITSSGNELLGARGSINSASLNRKDFSPVRPLELKLPMGIMFAAIIVAAIGVLVFLRVWSVKFNGISLPSNNTIVLSILENYLPTTFATLLEPIWVILNRLLCLLQPFDELRRGNAPSSMTVDVKYTSLPPQLVVWRALKARHFLLAAVCAVAISTNVLAVALSGLLSESPTNVILTSTTTQDILPKFNGTPITSESLLGAPILYSDHFYVALSNISGGTQLPAWIDDSFFYLPFNLNISTATTASSVVDVQGFHGTTTGFGAQVNCQELSPQQNNTVTFEPTQNGLHAQFETTHTLSNGTVLTCVSPRAPDGNETTGFTATLPSGLLALEVMQPMTSVSDIDDDGFCSSLLVAGWARLDRDTATSSSSFVGCRPTLRVAQFNVFVDTTGHVISSNQTSVFSKDVASFFTGNASETSLFQQTAGLIAPNPSGDVQWHNDTFTSDWMNALLELVGNSSSLVDPSASVPTTAEVAPLMEGLYRQLFAILLALNTHVFSIPEEPVSIVGEIITVESKILVSPVMFALAVAILGFHFVVSIWYYAERPRRFLPRMPTSIASIIAYVAASRAVQDTKESRANKEHDSNARYSYGRFIGPDGKSHVGIEHQRYVVPLKSRNPAVQRKRWRWRREDKDEKQPQTWI